MLEIVGHPVCVNPDVALRKVAVERDWPISTSPARSRCRPCAQRITSVNTKNNRRTALRVGAATVALGVAWYAARRRGTAS